MNIILNLQYTKIDPRYLNKRIGDNYYYNPKLSPLTGSSLIYKLKRNTHVNIWMEGMYSDFTRNINLHIYFSNAYN